MVWSEIIRIVPSKRNEQIEEGTHPHVGRTHMPTSHMPILRALRVLPHTSQSHRDNLHDNLTSDHAPHARSRVTPRCA